VSNYLIFPVESEHFHIPTTNVSYFHFFLQKLHSGSCCILILYRMVFVVNLKWLILYCNHWNLQLFAVLKGSLSICLISFSVNSNIVINFCLLVGWTWSLLNIAYISLVPFLAFQKNVYIPRYIWLLNFWSIISINFFGVFFLSKRWIHGISKSV
jgi:hypothetical protein